MTRSDERAWHSHLELKLRRTTGVHFQTFFSDVMQLRYGDDFVRLKPQGSLGDKGCDGYLNSTGAVFACYGAQNGAAGPQAALIKKMHEDFEKGIADLSGIMKSWHWTHNLIEGMPIDALLAFKALEADNSQLKFGLCGPPSIRDLFEHFDEHQREHFLGPQARQSDFLRLQMSEVKDLVDAIMVAVSGEVRSDVLIEPVSPEKLSHNDIPAAWSQMIQNGRVNAKYIDRYFDSHHDAMYGERVAQVFRDKYTELRSGALLPGAIMDELYCFVAGPENTGVDRQVAAYSLLAYLFESCDIFENVPEAWTAT